MGRHDKKGLDYFNIDCNQEDNLTLVEAKHGIEGYGVVIKLWKKAYSIHGYFCEWDEKNQYLFAKETGVKIDTLKAIIQTCFDEEIFHEGLYQNKKILTSSGIQKRWKKIVIQAKRKDVEIEPIYDVLVFIPEEMEKTPEEIVKNPEVIPQSKVKESKGNKSKVKESKDLGAKAPSEFWEDLVKVLFDFYGKNFKEKPSFDGRIPSDFKKLIERLKNRVLEKGFTWEKDNAPDHLRKFLEIACKDPWIKNNFLVHNLLNQFDKIILNGKNGTISGKKPTGSEVSTESLTEKIAVLARANAKSGYADEW
jgi:Domain of unknown function (DUF4373)